MNLIYNKGMQVLLVEDDDNSSFLAKRVLCMKGLDAIQEAYNGEEAFAMIAEDDSCCCPDLVFLDLTMPIMDGWDFLEAKSKHGCCPDLKVAILSSSDRESDREKAMKFPCVIDYIEKPLTSEKFDKLVAKHNMKLPE